MILLIDNYDSFTWNLAHLIGGAGHEFTVMRNDALSADEALAMGAAAIVLSPGPCTPTEAGISLALVGRAVETATPLFGVCLGLQSIAQALGGRIVRAQKLMHGKTSLVAHTAHPLFDGVPQNFTATRYHSLIAEKASLPSTLETIATSADDGEIMALAHRTAPVAGVQFHPESIASEHGARIFTNFMAWASAKTAATAPA